MSFTPVHSRCVFFFFNVVWHSCLVILSFFYLTRLNSTQVIIALTHSLSVNLEDVLALLSCFVNAFELQMRGDSLAGKEEEEVEE